MILDELIISSPPDDQWLTRLRRGHFVWCVKSKRFGKIEWAWEPPEPGCIAGRVGIRFCRRTNGGWRIESCQSWYVRPDGHGLDNKEFLHPVKDNCPGEPAEISEPWQRRTERTLGQLIHRVEQLDAQVARLEQREMDERNSKFD